MLLCFRATNESSRLLWRWRQQIFLVCLYCFFFQLGTWPTWWLRPCPHVRMCFYKMQIFQASAQQNNPRTHRRYLQIIMYTSNRKIKRFIVCAHAHSKNTMAKKKKWRLSNDVKYTLHQEVVLWPPKDTLGNQRIQRKAEMDKQQQWRSAKGEPYVWSNNEV